jgi:uncharacterized protein (TIGR02271 family)
MDLTREDIGSWRGRDLASSDGSKLGRIQEIYLDTETNEPEWALIHTGLFGTKETFVPLRDATTGDDQLRVPYEKSQVKDAPSIDPDGELSQSQEAELYRHYGLDYSESRSDTGLPEGGAGISGRTGDVSGSDRTVGHDVSGPETDDAMTRSEEELRVGTTERETGRVRLRKYIVTDEVQKTVPIKREEVRVEREAITDANRDDAMSGGDLTEEEHEVTLHSEEPVVEKRTVPKERVRLDKDVEVEERTVSEDVRREEIDVDDASTRDRR